MYTGGSAAIVDSEIINKIYKDKKFDRQQAEDLFGSFYENEYVHLTAGDQQSVIVRAKGQYLILVKSPDKKANLAIAPRNREQIMAMDALLDDSIKVCVFTGRAGTGKTLLTLATAMHKVEQRQYKKIILTRPMSQVGKYDLGALPGDVNDKFGPYLQNYICNFESILGDKKVNTADLIDMYNIEFIPMQLIRGASWANAFIIADEVQTLDFHEMLTLGTRVGENSKLVIMGDLGQRDEAIEKDRTGIYKFVNDPRVKNSKLTASVNLIKCERSDVAMLFADVFEAET